jgi:hypothetical protein
MIYATKGEWITCRQGHRIAQFNETVKVGDIQTDHPNAIRYLFTPPGLGDSFQHIICPMCGDRWCWHGGVFHFEKDGWRWWPLHTRKHPHIEAEQILIREGFVDENKREKSVVTAEAQLAAAGPSPKD